MSAFCQSDNSLIFDNYYLLWYYLPQMTANSNKREGLVTIISNGERVGSFLSVSHSQPQRLIYIDVIRGLSMIAIILGHFGNALIYRVVYTFNVPIFYLVTGYFMNTEISLAKFIKKRFKSLVIPYLITCLVMIFLAFLLNQSPGSWLMASLYGAGVQVGMMPTIGAIWFLLSSFWGSILLNVILRLPSDFHFLLALILFIVGAGTAKYFWLPLSIQPGLCAVLFMYAGHLWRISQPLAGKIGNEFKTVFKICALVLWLDFIINFRGFGLVNCFFGRGSIDIIESLGACAVVIGLCLFASKRFGKLTKGVSFLGANSLIVLCVHCVELYFVPWSKWIDPLPIVRSVPHLPFVTIACCKIAFAFLSVYVYLWIKK